MATNLLDHELIPNFILITREPTESNCRLRHEISYSSVNCQNAKTCSFFGLYDCRSLNSGLRSIPRREHGLLSRTAVVNRTQAKIVQTPNTSTSTESFGTCYTGGRIRITEYGELKVNSSKDRRRKEDIGCIKPLVLQRLLLS